MTVNELITELLEYTDDGYGDKPVYWMNLNIQEEEETEDVSPLPSGQGLVVR